MARETNVLLSIEPCELDAVLDCPAKTPSGIVSSCPADALQDCRIEVLVSAARAAELAPFVSAHQEVQVLSLQDTWTPAALQEMLAAAEHVQTLDASATGLSSIPPATFQHATSLQTLILDDNRLTLLSANLFANLSSLKYL